MMIYVFRNVLEEMRSQLDLLALQLKLYRFMLLDFDIFMEAIIQPKSFPFTDLEAMVYAFFAQLPINIRSKITKLHILLPNKQTLSLVCKEVEC
jgi:hypothetical protein